MLEKYHAHGVQFRFPKGWTLSEQAYDDEATITVESPETSFWSLSLFFDGPSTEHVIETAVDVLKQDYDEIDIYPANVRLCRRDSLARDAEFVCFELLNSAFLRAFETDDFTALVYYQGTDHELAQTRPVLEGICQSLEWDGDSDPEG